MTLLCVPLVARTVEAMRADAAAAAAAGADLVEIRFDFIGSKFRPREDLPRLLRGCPLPAIVTYRSEPRPSPALATLPYVVLSQAATAHRALDWFDTGFASI